LRRAEIIEPWRYLLRPFGEKELCITIEMAMYANRLKKELDETTRRYRDISELVSDYVFFNSDRAGWKPGE